MTQKELRAKKARNKMLHERAAAQAFNQSIWSTIAYRHGHKTFSAHGAQPVKQSINYGEVRNDE